MKLSNLNTVFKLIIIILLTSLFLWFSLDFGFWLSGDMHSGGSLIGPLLTPILTLSLIIILFYSKKMVRINAIKILLTFISFMISSFIILYFTDYFLIFIFKEYFLIDNYIIWINIFRLALIIYITTKVYFQISSIIKKKMQRSKTPGELGI